MVSLDKYIIHWNLTNIETKPNYKIFPEGTQVRITLSIISDWIIFKKYPVSSWI